MNWTKEDYITDQQWEQLKQETTQQQQIYQEHIDSGRLSFVGTIEGTENMACIVDEQGVAVYQSVFDKE